MKNMADTFAPIMITTLCRYEHFKRCIESLVRNTYADRTELYIGLDYPLKESHWEGYRKIKEYVYTITGFKQVYVFERERNYGARENYWALRREIEKKYDCIIITEDDNEFSPCFLDFMNKALVKYWDEERVRTVGAYLGEEFEGIKQAGTIFTYSNTAWGAGVWKHKDIAFPPDEYYQGIINDRRRSWKLFSTTPGCWVMLYRMVKRGLSFGDVKRESYNCMNDTFQVRPYTSLVRNWGNDGSGIHCVTDNARFISVDILDCKYFDELSDCEVTLSVPRVRMIFQNLPSRKTLRGWLVLGKYSLIFLKVFLVGK